MAYGTPRPIPPGVVEIDDSRLREMWTRHQQRSLFTARAVRWIGVAAVLGISAVLAAIALAFWALERKPPVVNVAPAEVHVAGPTINIPKQDPPVINPVFNLPKQDPPNFNFTVPPPAQPAPAVPPAFPLVPQSPQRDPGNSVNVEYTIFHTVKVDNGQEIWTGWNYHNSSETRPFQQYCYWRVSSTLRFDLASDGVPLPNLAQTANDIGVSYADALRYLPSCMWFGE